MADADPDSGGEQPEGLDLAKSIARGLVGKTGINKPRALQVRRERRDRGESGYTGPGADPRDPQTLDVSIGGIVAEQGWAKDLKVQEVFARWSAIVGDDVGNHTTPETLVEGRLSVRADSTAWATQLKFLAPQILLRLNDVLGDGSVETIDVRGPSAPARPRGRLRVKGRGPRDTWG